MFLKQNIPKIKKVLQSVLILLATLAVALSLNTLQVRADDFDTWARSIVDSQGSDGSASTTEIEYGVSTQRTGYLCYLLDKNGNAVPGTNAIALSSPSFSYYPGTYSWIVQSRKGGYTASGFNGTAPWNCTPWQNAGGDSYPTNEPQIKDWFETVGSDNVQNSAKFVQDNWNNTDITLKFGQGEYFIIVETIMHFQYSEKSSGGITRTAEEVYNSLVTRYRLMPAQALINQAPKGVRDAYTAGEMTEDELRSYLVLALTRLYNSNPSKFEVREAEGWNPIGPYRLVGTPANMIKYRNTVLNSNTNVFDKFTHKIACFAEFIQPGNIGEQIGFTAWRGGTSSKISDSDVFNYGVAMMVISATNPTQTTAQESQIPNPHPAPVESTGNFSIIKSYRTKNTDTNQYTDDGTHSTSNLGNQITIENERDYQVVGWRITDSTSTSVSSINWNPPGSVKDQGTTPTSVTIESPYKTLYVLLEKLDTPEPEVEDYNYKLTQSSITRRINFSQPDNRLTNMDNQSEQIESQTFKWIIPAHRTSCPGNHPFTAACHGEHDGEHDSSCAKKCPDTCTQEHPTGSHITEDCQDHHHYDCGERCQTQYASCSYGEWEEKNLKLSINNKLQGNYPDILATKEGWNKEVSIGHLTKHYYLNDASFERDSTDSKQYEESNWDYVCVLLRGKDKLTVAQWENAGQGNGLTTAANSDLANVSSSGFTIANTDSGTRKTQDYMETFAAKFDTEEHGHDGADNSTTYKPNGDATVDAPDTAKGSVRCEPETVYAYVNNPLEVNNIKVKVETYSGSASEGTNDTSFNASPVLTLSRQGYDVSSGRMIQTGSTISFRPYIKMKYDTLTATNQPAYVLSEYQRQMTPNAYAEISWNNPGARNLTLTSAQWSTHAQATQNHGTNSVLPGGATLSLNINADNRQQVTVTSYYPIVTGHGKTQIDNAGGSYTNLTEATAQSLHEQFVSSVQQALDTTIIQQYVDTDDTKSTAFGGIQVNPGSSITELHNGSSTASTEDKYYFRPDNTASGLTEGDLDVQQSSNTETTYTFFTTTNGALKMTINNTTPKENTPDQGAYSYIGNMLDARTGVRTKLEAAVERHTGSDPEAITGTNWYNEAFDGVTIIQFDTVLTVGFQDPPERSQVLDPKLIPKQVNSTTENKDLFSDYFISQFRTRNYSELNQTPYIMGRYNGQTVQMINLEKLFTSRPFYIPNLTTQDLHS